jgi:isoleucyl-tRNA synthetase
VRAPSDSAANALDSHQDQILEELNVKAIEFIARDAGLVSYRIKPNLPRIGKQYGKLIPLIRKALEDADGGAIASAAASGETFEILAGDQTITLEGEDVLIETHSAKGYACAEDSGYLTALDTTLTDELVNEGFAREIVRSVQDARKQAGLEVSDRITLGISGSDAVEKALEKHRDYVMNETLATTWETGQSNARFSESRELGEDHWTIEISLQSSG